MRLLIAEKIECRTRAEIFELWLQMLNSITNINTEDTFEKGELEFIMDELEK